MGDLKLGGNLNLMGMLTLKGDGGKVKVGDTEVLVQVVPPGDGAQCSSAPPVIMPPPPATPLDTGTKVWIINSFNQTVMAGSRAIVTQGIAMQGGNTSPVPIWPGMVLPSSNNSTVTINHLPINVVGDKAVIFPNGGSASFDQSGQ